jgi:hypothetical protein
MKLCQFRIWVTAGLLVLALSAFAFVYSQPIPSALSITVYANPT